MGNSFCRLLYSLMKTYHMVFIGVLCLLGAMLGLSTSSEVTAVAAQSALGGMSIHEMGFSALEAAADAELALGAEATSPHVANAIKSALTTRRTKCKAECAKTVQRMFGAKSKMIKQKRAVNRANRLNKLANRVAQLRRQALARKKAARRARRVSRRSRAAPRRRHGRRLRRGRRFRRGRRPSRFRHGRRFRNARFMEMSSSITSRAQSAVERRRRRRRRHRFPFQLNPAICRARRYGCRRGRRGRGCRRDRARYCASLNNRPAAAPAPARAAAPPPARTAVDNAGARLAAAAAQRAASEAAIRAAAAAEAQRAARAAADALARAVAKERSDAAVRAAAAAKSAAARLDEARRTAEASKRAAVAHAKRTAEQRAAADLRTALERIKSARCNCKPHINLARNSYETAQARARAAQVRNNEQKHVRDMHRRAAKATNFAKAEHQKAVQAAKLRNQAIARSRALAARLKKQGIPKQYRAKIQAQLKGELDKISKRVTAPTNGKDSRYRSTNARLNSAMLRVARATTSLTKLRGKLNAMKRALGSHSIKRVIQRESEGAIRNYLEATGLSSSTNKVGTGETITQWIPADAKSQHKLYKYHATTNKPVYLPVLESATNANRDAYALHSEVLTFLEDDQIAHRQAQEFKKAQLNRM